MSGYSDERYDDRSGDRRDDDRPLDGERTIERARSMVTAPAIGLIVVGVLSLLAVVLGVIQYPGLDAQFDEAIQELENKPNVPQDTKKQQIAFMNKIRDGMKVALPVLWCLVSVQAVITLIGGLKLRKLTGRGWVVAGSVLSMIPLISGCCLLGLVFGIWALVVLGKPEVKAAYEANAGSRHPDDHYMR